MALRGPIGVLVWYGSWLIIKLVFWILGKISFKTYMARTAVPDPVPPCTAWFIKNP